MQEKNDIRGMKKFCIISLFLLVVVQNVFSQTKKIEGDTVYWFNYNKELGKTLELKDLNKSSDEFNFRFWNHGQVVELSKDSSSINGTLTNYIYHTKNSKRNKRELLFKKVILSPEQAKIAYNFVESSEILNLQTDKKIENWSQGFDGITYIIEHSNKNYYYFKNYWTPTAQDSIPEALIVLNFVNKLSDTLSLEENYKLFKEDLPKKGCYNSGGMVNMCYVANSLELGYSGATKLPLGFYAAYSATFLGKSKVDFGTLLEYNFDNNGFRHLNFQTSKWNLFYKKSNLSDFMTYNYQNRKLDVDEVNNRFQNHQVKYGLNLINIIGVGIGVDYMIRENEKIGGHLYVSKWLTNPGISTTLTTSIFDNQINYKLQMFKSFNLNSLPIYSISLGLAYEKYIDYKDLYFKFLVSM